ncbi:integrase DNA-binding domain-containing protein [Ruthenibacterium lactatiformans]|nr:integrase DNA-binding domain-containing protein [Ruthenibacterium lactatiformans]
MPKIRKDNKGRNLRPGETQRSDGSYMFVYKQAFTSPLLKR